jgi:RNA polymerase sigma-70 factor (ECF subfamily)
LPSVTDEQLVASLSAGDTDCLATLVTRWERPLHRFVYRLLQRPEDARDVCQETFLRVLRRADRFRPGSRFSTWMYQIALNLCRDHMRRRKRWGLIFATAPESREPVTETAPATDAEDPSTFAERQEMGRAISDALSRIPPQQREVLILKEYEGLKFKEIAELLGCPESTVKSRMYYGLNGIGFALERRGITRA